MHTISIAEDFSPAPSGRHISDGDHTGEHFRIELLKPALEDHTNTVVIFDGLRIAPNSFLEEAFGGLVREEGFSLDDLKKRMKLSASDESLQIYLTRAWTFIEESAAAKK